MNFIDCMEGSKLQLELKVLRTVRRIVVASAGGRHRVLRWLPRESGSKAEGERDDDP